MNVQRRTASGAFRIGEGLHWATYDEQGQRVAQGRDFVTTPSAEQLARWDAAALDIARRWAGRWQELDQPLYIRFGELPRGGRSRNHATGRREAGVSCYEAEYNMVTGALELTGEGLPGAAIFAAAGAYGKVTLLLTGQEIGYGSDNEPLLHNVKTLGRLIYNPDLGGFTMA